MLRLVLLIVGLALAVTGLVLRIQGNCGYLPFLIWGCVLTIAVLFERWRYQRKEHGDDGRWHGTGERFEDPETGKTVEVQYDPVSGERRYVKK